MAAAESIADRAGRGDASVDPQDGLFDSVLDNEMLEAALERLQKAKEKLKAPKKEHTQAKDAAVGMVAGLEMAPGEGDEPVVVRCGRFRIKLSYVDPGHRSFDTSESVRTTISLLG